MCVCCIELAAVMRPSSLRYLASITCIAFPPANRGFKVVMPGSHRGRMYCVPTLQPALLAACCWPTPLMFEPDSWFERLSLPRLLPCPSCIGVASLFVDGTCLLLLCCGPTTTTTAARLAVSLRTLTLHNTAMHGALPGYTREQVASGSVNSTHVCGSAGAGLGRLPALQIVYLTGSSLTAVCPHEDGACGLNDLLPW